MSEDVVVSVRGCLDLLMELPGEWSILQCSQCRLRFTAPRMNESEILQFYPSTYHVYHPDVPIRSKTILSIIRRLAMAPYSLRFGEADHSFTPFGSRRFLDIGCGAGQMLQRMASQGWSCTGIDISPIAVAVARQTLPGASLEVATLSTFKPEATFALISMMHVLEHMPDPVASLMRCRQLLEPGGVMLVAVPNIESVEARAFGRRWIGLDIPRHLMHFSRSTLTELLKRSGFQVVSVRPSMFASSLAESVALSLPRPVRRRLLGTKSGRMLYFAAVLPAAISYACGNAPVLEVLSRRAA